MTRIAICGAGRMGQRHLEVVRALGLSVVAVSDPRGAALSEAADRFDLHNRQLFTDPRDALATGPDGVIVASTAPSHARLTIDAAKAGAAWVLCEKPMAASLEECDEMIQACTASDTRLAVNHQMRFMDQYLRVRQIIEDPAFGGWTSITAAVGNFGLAMNGVHYFELFRWLTGEPAGVVTAWLDDDLVPNPRGLEFTDRSGAVRLESAGGRRHFYLDASGRHGHGVRLIYAGGAGVAVADELGGTILVSQREADARQFPTTRYGCAAEEMTVQVAPADVIEPTRRVLDALMKDEDYPTGEDGRNALAVYVAAHLSHEAGHQPIAVASVPLPKSRRFPIA